MQPSALRGRQIIYRTSNHPGWRDAITSYQRSASEVQRCLGEMKKANSKWAYHYDRQEFKEFSAGTLEKGFKNIFLTCQRAATIHSEEALIIAQVASSLLNAIVRDLNADGVVTNEEELEAVRKFLRKKAKHPTHRKILELHPQSLMKVFNKNKTATFKSAADKQVYKLMKAEIDSQMSELSVSLDNLLVVFLEHVKDKRRLDLFLLQEEAAWTLIAT